MVQDGLHVESVCQSDGLRLGTFQIGFGGTWPFNFTAANFTRCILSNGQRVHHERLKTCLRLQASSSMCLDLGKEVPAHRVTGFGLNRSSRMQAGQAAIRGAVKVSQRYYGLRSGTKIVPWVLESSQNYKGSLSKAFR